MNLFLTLMGYRQVGSRVWKFGIGIGIRGVSCRGVFCRFVRLIWEAGCVTTRLRKNDDEKACVWWIGMPFSERHG
jgi:hypothetical protein